MEYVLTTKRYKMPVFPIVYTMIAQTSKFMETVLGKKFNKIILLTKDGFEKYFVLEKDREILSEIFMKKLNENKSLTKNYIKALEKNGKELLKFTGSINLNSKNLGDYFKNYKELYTKAMAYGWPISIIGEYALVKELKQKIKDEETLSILSTPKEISYVYKEEINALKLALKKADENKIKAHTKKFSWIFFDYTGPELGFDYFKKRIAELEKEGKDKLKERLNFLESREHIKNQQDTLINQLNLSKEDIIKIKALQDIVFIRDKRKEILTKAHYDIEKLLDKVAEIRKIDKEILRWLYTEELVSLAENKQVDIKKAEERFRFSAIVSENGKTKEYFGDEAEKYFNSIEEKISSTNIIKGICACMGNAKGIAKIIKKIEDGCKLNKGDILVTPMTTVDFTPIMEKASAIVTDDGGITCHAAIISREMNIPCVIGTRIATEVLNDGDYIEVNADKGIVTIIKRK